jgi:hypothetical protein
VRGQRHAPAALYTRERPYIHCTGGWVGPRVDLDKCGKFRPFPPPPAPPGFDPRTVQPVASRYTDYATRPIRIWRSEVIFRSQKGYANKNVWENTVLANQTYFKLGISAQKLNFRSVPTTTTNSGIRVTWGRLLRNVKRGHNRPRNFPVVNAGLWTVRAEWGM